MLGSALEGITSPNQLRLWGGRSQLNIIENAVIGPEMRIVDNNELPFITTIPEKKCVPLFFTSLQLQPVNFLRSRVLHYTSVSSLDKIVPGAQCTIIIDEMSKIFNNMT